MYQWLREVCSTRLLQDPPIVLGGQGAVLQIDESLFRHKPKVTACTSAPYSVAYILSTQNHRGRATTQEVWVFGIVDTSHQPALGYMEVVHRCDAATLLPIIQAHAAPGSIVHSDEWSSYRRVQQLGNASAHNTVNHSLHFVDPVTGVHIQHVESYWNRVKGKLKQIGLETRLDISIKMLKDVGMAVPKSRETSAVYICTKTGDEGMQQ